MLKTLKIYMQSKIVTVAKDIHTFLLISLPAYEQIYRCKFHQYIFLVFSFSSCMLFFTCANLQVKEIIL